MKTRQVTKLRISSTVKVKATGAVGQIQTFRGGVYQLRFSDGETHLYTRDQLVRI